MKIHLKLMDEDEDKLNNPFTTNQKERKIDKQKQAPIKLG